ncbi:MAG: hypothetical protein ACR2K1_02025 [Saprospiraceae bacterium]
MKLELVQFGKNFYKSLLENIRRIRWVPGIAQAHRVHFAGKKLVQLPLAVRFTAQTALDEFGFAQNGKKPNCVLLRGTKHTPVPSGNSPKVHKTSDTAKLIFAA